MIDDKFINVKSWFDKKYRLHSVLRYLTFKTALNLFMQNDGGLIVETGTVRGEDDWGAGMSTVMFGDFVHRYGAKLITVDIDPENIKLSKEITKKWADSIEYVVDDSLKFLGNFNDKIDLLYLDSLDFPFGDDFSPEQSKKMAITSQQHQLKELKLSLKNLSKGSIILLDDNDFPLGGKTLLTKIYLRSINAACLIDAYQSLWIL